MKSEAKRIYQKRGNTPVIIYQKVFKKLFEKLGGGLRKLLCIWTGWGKSLSLTRTSLNPISQGLAFPNVGEEKYLVKNPAFSAAYKGIMSKKARVFILKSKTSQ